MIVSLYSPSSSSFISAEKIPSPSVDGFIGVIKRRIPVLEKSLDVNYKHSNDKESREFTGINQVHLSQAKWGMFFPVDSTTGASDILFLMDIFSPRFLVSVFTVSQTGIQRPMIRSSYGMISRSSEAPYLFRGVAFEKFFQRMKIFSPYASLFLPNRMKWQNDDWRLAVACHMFLGLRHYEGAKDLLIWQREASDMAIILETLLTASDKTKEEVGFRLKQRATVLVGSFFPLVKKDLTNLYDTRSFFVHGSVFANPKEIIRKAKLNAEKNKNEEYHESSFPVPDVAVFNELLKQRQIVRFVLISSLLILEAKNEGAFPGYSNMCAIFDGMILDVDLRKKVHNIIRPVLRTVPIDL